MAAADPQALRRLCISLTLLALCGCADTSDPCDGASYDPATGGCLDASAADASLDASAPDASAPDAGPCGSCPASAPVCDVAASPPACVQCTASDASACTGMTPMCDPTMNTCVACLEHGDCTDPTRAQCLDGACVPCDAAAQCAGRANAELCAADGACVECTLDDESACGENSCDPAARACTGTRRGSLVTCEACVADSECMADHRCIPMDFDGDHVGDFCMRVHGGTDCVRPFTSLLTDRASLSGAPAETYCGIDEGTVSCAAVRALQLSHGCAGGVSECMAPGALCRGVGGTSNQCTYACGTNNECPPSGPASTCRGGYCGGS